MAVKKVKNKATGMIHTVPDGHWSLTSDKYTVVKPPAKRKKKNVSNAK